jgi:hypothetical protein
MDMGLVLKGQVESMLLCYRWFETTKSTEWFKPCEISSEHGIRNSTIHGHSSMMFPSMKISSGGHKQRRRQSVDMVRRFAHFRVVQLTWNSRNNTQRALGSPLLDRRGTLSRIRQDSSRERYSIRKHEILPPNVPMEQRSFLQTPCPGEHPILLASRTQSSFLLRRGLRCLPIHGGLQQDVRVYD